LTVRSFLLRKFDAVLEGTQMETIILGLFCGFLCACLIAGLSVLYALLAGLFLFCLYAGYKGFAPREILAMLVSGVRSVKTLPPVFLLVGMMTGVWRASGTIPVFLCYASGLFLPQTFLLTAFLLNCLLSFLIGSSLGTAATMGAVTMAAGNLLGIPAAPLGGAILSAIYFGDRCSPVSTSALLVRELTGTDTYRNIRNMFRSAAIPFLLSCLLYFSIGLALPSGTAASIDPGPLLGQTFTLHPVLLVPAGLVLITALMRVDIKLSMTLGIVSAVLLCLTVQHMDLSGVLRVLWSGYLPSDPEAILSGGGILSMWKAITIVCLTCSYAELFRCTGLLNRAQAFFKKLCGKTGTFPGILCASILTAAVACNQTLCILLTHQLCGEMEEDKYRLALSLEDTSVLIPALLPWSVACSAALSSIGAPGRSVLYAFFLWLVPGFGLIRELFFPRTGTGD